MNRKFTSTIFSAMFLTTAMLIVTGCGGGNSSGGGFVASPSDGSGTGTGGTGGTVSSVGMYVSLVALDQPMTTYFHPFGRFSSSCNIASNAPATDLECILNVSELDLAAQGVKMDLNVPAGMCDYVSDVPYSFLNYQPGAIAKTVDVVYDANSGGTKSCTVKDQNGVNLTTSFNGETCVWSGGSATPTGTMTCDYDYSTQDPAGPNCCEGAYSFTGQYKAAGSTDFVAASLANKKYGGKNSLCLAGPYLNASSGWKYDTKSGAPYEQVRIANAVGFNQYYTVTAANTMYAVDNTYGANFWDWANYSTTSTQLTSTLPVALTRSLDKSNVQITAAATPHVSYEFRCYDKAMEVKHRIRVYINEWDTVSAFAAYGASNGSTATSPINHTTSCGSSFSETCDDLWSWSEYPTGYPQLDFTTK